MPTDINFPCPKCSETITISANIAGKQIVCPFCRTHVIVPGDVKSTKGEDAHHAQKNEDKPLPSHRGMFVSLIIAVVVIIVGYLGYMGLLGAKESKKDINVLFQEYAKGDTSVHKIILKKVKPENLDTLILYSSNNNKDVRILVAESLGNIHNEGSISVLSTLMKDQEEKVRVAAATSLGKIPDTKSVDTLIGALVNEKSRDVMTAMGRSLRDLTGQTLTLGDPASWALWWDKNKHKYFKK